MHRAQGASNGRKLTRRRALGLAALGFGVIVLVCAATIVLLPNSLVSGFVENRLLAAIAASHPEFSVRLSGFRFEVMRNRLSCDSLALIRSDSSFSCRVDSLSVSGIHWLGLLRGGTFDPGILGGTVIQAGATDVRLSAAGYTVRSGPLRISVPDSEIAAEALEIHPLLGDEEFFGAGKFRVTRIDFRTGTCSISGLGCAGLLGRKTMQARSIRLQGVSVDILINKDKPPGVVPPGPRMPNEFLAALNDTVVCDSVIVDDGNLKYSERMTAGGKPATLTIAGVQALVTGIAGRPGRYVESNVEASGTFAGGGILDLAMSIPIGGTPGSFHYSGSLEGMYLGRLNSFIEVSDHMRIKSGALESAAFDIDVNAGSATGTVRTVYRNLVIASIDGRTGSEEGVIDRFSSWIARNLKIRGTNVPDGSGAMKIGRVKYTRKRADPFVGFAWFALRSGIGDVVGF